MVSLALSYVVVTDTCATIAPLLSHLRRQSAVERIELVLVTPSRHAIDELPAAAAGIGRVVVVEADINNYAHALAQGIHKAMGPYVFLGETHSFPDPRFVETLMRTFAKGDWSVVAPGIGNGNPSTHWSWAAYLCDYACWSSALPAGECAAAPIYNAAYRLSLLQEFGADLERLLARSDSLPRALQARGARTLFEPTARLAHVNIAQPRTWIDERMLTGHLVAAHRTRIWGAGWRLVYLLASPLIALVLFRRVLPGAWLTIRRQRLSPLLLLWILAGMVLRAWGEFLGYLGLSATDGERRMQDYELHKLDYAALPPGQRF
ncbi:glycosyltransferase [Synechococcus sp. Cruz-9H2]|uniref:glycosyltransferase n=1 Tax=unclassified Synechococcus TaxID=2626047 RepID=UPI0020CD461B|nr:MULTISPECIES: glycosyltransferase [unclassified Synechococcus]MCP9818865.1 glycosyltransferase [Synechococcus sp. Cruz-9H2]MCP9843368.1 glycosyltransferase [Synechococcus sp. Edmonson 11F2]MCP9855249.1 glycosyltransferase [Synechococcus sp. Cruz-9C9]MCP9862778.1 glycosyltransferase [Synechococcus sp. Cruz-7E5]MCP9869775.1 glycosyltransferase [Synechococcus sp. Cruz-7B9]